MSRYQRPIETVSSLLGRPAFFYGIVLFVTGWVLLNVFSPRFGVAPFDPAPYLWLQGLVGLGALLTTIIVLITQSRQGKLAEQRAQLDLQVSLLSEQKIAKLIALVEELRRDLPDVKNRHDAEAAAMEQSTDPHAILDALETVQEPVKQKQAASLQQNLTPGRSFPKRSVNSSGPTVPSASRSTARSTRCRPLCCPTGARAASHQWPCQWRSRPWREHHRPGLCLPLQ